MDSGSWVPNVLFREGLGGRCVLGARCPFDSCPAVFVWVRDESTVVRRMHDADGSRREA